MNIIDKKQSIRNRVNELLKDSFIDAEKMVNKAIDSGEVDIESWGPEINSWILPKIIATAILQKLSENYDGKGTNLEKEVKHTASKIKVHL